MIQFNIVPFDNEYRPNIQAIRQHVFCNEQGIAPELEFDGLDTSAIHAIALVDGNLVGTGRMLSDGHIGRIAVLKSFRGLHIGSNIVLALIEEARRKEYQRVYLGAQQQAVNFYVKLGFTPIGEPFMEAGIEHISMEKML